MYCRLSSVYTLGAETDLEGRRRADIRMQSTDYEATLESSVHLLWLAQETSEKNIGCLTLNHSG